MRTVEAHYWDEIAGVWRDTCPQALWRVHSDLINISLVSRWLGTAPVRCLLKTDLFDEAYGPGLYPMLKSRSRHVTGIDISTVTLSAALSRRGDLDAACADVRRLPFADEAFDAVVSNSTLDHFASFDDVILSLRELRRVLKPGGHLLLTLDNLANPLVALRGFVPFSLLNRLGVVPYYIGATCGPRRLCRILRRLDWEIIETDALMHAPRVLAVAIGRVLEKYVAPKTHRGFLRLLMSFERLSSWPTRFLTGYYIAVRARKPPSALA
jgi:SAM-dependent methyltransferase